MLSESFSEVAAVIEWGFEEVKWQLEQQTDVLRSIEHTLKTPSETQANEWRRMAEELRGRGVLDKSEGLFLKALDLNPLDYRIYVGLAQTYLQMNQFHKAKTRLEESLLHAPPRPQIDQYYRKLRVGGEEHFVHVEWKPGPYSSEAEERENKKRWLSPEKYEALKKQVIDYRSYSYRLIGHIYACEENYGQALRVLQSAVELSPNYGDAHYDYSQYCALVGEKESCLASLQKAISANPLYFSLAQKERNFAPIRGEVDNLLGRRKAEILHEAEQAISLAEEELSKVKKAIPMIEVALLRSLGCSERDIEQRKVTLEAKRRLEELVSKKLYHQTQSHLQALKEGLPSRDYRQLLRTKELALECKALAINAKEKAEEQREEWSTKAEEKGKERRQWLLGVLSSVMLLGGFVGVSINAFLGNWPGVIIGIGAIIAGGIGLYRNKSQGFWK